MTRPHTPRTARDAGPKPGRAPADTFYSDLFSPEELALVAAFVSDPTLDDEIWLQRVLNHRLFHYLDDSEPGAPLEVATLVKVAEALGAGTTRVARLLRDRRALSGEAADGLAGAIAAALDELTTDLGIKL